jgi:hypothetical protein
MRNRHTSILMASVSFLAIAASVHSVQAGEPGVWPVSASEDAAPDPSPNAWSVWLEGGAESLSGGGTYVAGFAPGFSTSPIHLGWSGAAGFDYRYDPTWHLSGDFRYGAHGRHTRTSTPLATFAGVPTASGTVTGTAVGTNTANRSE